VFDSGKEDVEDDDRQADMTGHGLGDHRLQRPLFYCKTVYTI